MILGFTPQAWEEYCDWQRDDLKILDKINVLIREIARDPFRGSGKPEPLKGNLAGYWSRRITREHRIVYQVTGKEPDKILTIIQLKFHY